MIDRPSEDEEGGTFSPVFDKHRSELTELIHEIHGRGWSPGTGGNFSQVLSREPLRLLVTPSGVDKGYVKPSELLEVDADGKVLVGDMPPSAETLLHIVIAQETDAGVILHTHSIWNTLASLSEKDGGYAISHFEMLKGLQGIRTHEHTEVIPVLKNSQEMNSLGEELRKILRDESNPHGVLLKGHGLYTWGRDIFEARRHLEVLEFLFEVSVRARSLEQ